MEKLIGFLTPALVYFFMFVLNAVMPGRWVNGYIARRIPMKNLNTGSMVSWSSSP